jgi:hypothetical protein
MITGKNLAHQVDLSLCFSLSNPDFTDLISIQSDDNRGISSRRQISIRLYTEDIKIPNIISQEYLDEECGKGGDGMVFNRRV